MDNIILDFLRAHADGDYAGFMRALSPTVPPERILGVRTPVLRQFAKTLRGTETAGTFLQALPHTYFEENQLHAFLLSGLRDFDVCVRGVEAFLPFVDNWATCDQLRPAVFAKHKTELLPHIDAWIESGQTYTIRFGIGMLMCHFLDGDFDLRYPETVAAVRSEEYYVRMMCAWYFATALAKQYDAVLPFLQTQTMDVWTHNKTIQKSVESYRLTAEQKTYLKTLKIKR